MNENYYESLEIRNESAKFFDNSCDSLASSNLNTLNQKQNYNQLISPQSIIKRLVVFIFVSKNRRPRKMEQVEEFPRKNDKKELKEEKPKFVARTPTDIQRIKLEKLMKNPVSNCHLII